MKVIKLAIAEDIPELAKISYHKFSSIEGIDLIFIASNGLEMLEHPDLKIVDVVLMDINMPIMNGIESTAKIKEAFPDIKVIMHTIFDEDDKIFESILAGASGYLLKDDSLSKVLEGIDEVVEGGAPMSVSIASKVLSIIKNDREKSVQTFALTSRELQILQKIGKGENHKKISEDLFISPKTVRNHIENIYKKLQVHNKVEAVTLAIKNKLIV
jgi:DNA-binding NarL/FixJ family response regulator